MARVNSYFVCLPGTRGLGRPWDPTDPDDLPIADCRYFGKALAYVDEQIGNQGLCVYLTWNVSALPSYGKNVVAVVLGDEWCRVPRYAHRVRAVFKCYGLRRNFDLTRSPDAIWWASLAQATRISVAGIPFAIAHAYNSALGRTANIWDIPLGYLNQVDLPAIPIASRSYDVFFAGSVLQREESRFGRRYVLRDAKTISRSEMVEALERFREARPDRVIELRTTASFGVSAQSDAYVYSEALRQTKVCIVPRGTSLETFRWFEALRFGCVVVCEKLPRRRYYDDSPVIVLSHWDQLADVLDEILADLEAMQTWQLRAERWWRDNCSELATGAFMVECLRLINVS